MSSRNFGGTAGGGKDGGKNALVFVKQVPKFLQRFHGIGQDAPKPQRPEDGPDDRSDDDGPQYVFAESAKDVEALVGTDAASKTKLSDLEAKAKQLKEEEDRKRKAEAEEERKRREEEEEAEEEEQDDLPAEDGKFVFRPKSKKPKKQSGFSTVVSTKPKPPSSSVTTSTNSDSTNASTSSTSDTPVSKKPAANNTTNSKKAAAKPSPSISKPTGSKLTFGEDDL